MSNKKKYYSHNSKGDIMKKYFFLFFLIIIYIFINSSRSEHAFLNTDNNYNIIDKMHISFNNGINSKKLISILNEYDYEYFIDKINIYNKDYDIKCNSIESCIKDLYNLFDDSFYDKYIMNGFKINNIDIIVKKDKFIEMLNNKNIAFTYN